MKKNQKLLALLLSLLMVLPLASCSETTSDETAGTNAPSAEETTADGETTPEETAEERLPLGVPEKDDFGGQEIRFLVWNHTDWADTVRSYRDIYAEALNGEAINDTVYNRNLLIQGNYNVVIAEEKLDLGQIATTVDQEVAAGTNTYSVIYPRLYEAASMYQKNYFHNLLALDNIDLTQPWWDANSVESLSVMGKLTAVATSLNINDKDATAALAFNKGIAANHQLEDIYTIVREGKWTYDKLSELADIADTDVDGDGTVGENDVLGLLGGNDVMTAFWLGSGSQMVTKDETGAFVFSFGTDRDITSATKVVEMMNQPWFLNHHDTTKISSTDDTYYRQLFETGHGLFFWMRLDEVTNMRNGDADFGIIPTPKYEEAQDGYYSLVSQHTTGLMSLPITLTGDQLNAVTTVLEAMAYESHYTLIPEYIESSLKTKHSRDAESADMLDIVINNRVFDPMVIYNFGSFAGTFQGLGLANNTNFSSLLKSSQKVVGKTIEKFVEAITETE